MSTSDKVSRRQVLKTAGAAIGGLAIGAALGYGGAQSMAGPSTSASTQVTRTETASSAGPPIKEIAIGVIEMLTGGGAGPSQEVKRIYDQYIGDYNAAGGVRSGLLKGAKIKLVYADTQTNVEIARSEAERLVTSGTVNLIMGANWTSQTIPMKEVCDRHHFPLLNGLASNVALTQGANNHWFWRTQAHDAQFNQYIFTFLKDLQQKTGIQLKTLGLIWPNDTYGSGWRDYIVNVANKDPNFGGYDIVCDLSLVVGTSAEDSEVLTIKKTNPDIVLNAQHEAESIIFTKALRQYDVNEKLIISGGEILVSQFGDGVGKLADGQCVRATSSWDLNKANTKAFNEEYKAKYNVTVGDWGSTAAIQAATTAFEIVQEPSVEPKVLQQAFNSLYIPGEDLLVPWGIKFYPPGMFDAGQNMLASGIVVQYTGAYEVHTVWPWDVATKDISFPVPTWSARGL